MNILKKNDTILFQGDSITDCGRIDSPDGLGSGYVSIIHGLLGSLKTDLNLTIINRGISGDRTEELLMRWKEDCEEIKPDILSINIGVNDVWRKLKECNGQTYIDPEQYISNYKKLLDRALKAGVRKLILCSPTTIENNKNSELSELLEERRNIVINLVKEYKAVYVPLQEFQLSLLESCPAIMWTIDGCHPSIAGHSSLAFCWLQSLKLL